MQMMVDGIIVPRPEPPEFPSFTRYLLTDFGKEWIKEQAVIPEDSQGYLTVLRQSIPKLDSVIEQYVNEALLTYNRCAFFAAAVMVGAASEKALYLLMEAYGTLFRIVNPRQPYLMRLNIGVSLECLSYF